MDMELLLADEGCEVLEPVATVEDALSAIAEHEPQVVLLDLNLDGNPTVAIAEELLKRKIPFVIVSGFVKTSVSEPTLQQAPFVQKPWSKAELLRMLAKVLG